MTLPTDELLARLATTLRNDIGPAIGDDYTRTQAYMAAVILERVSRQVGLAPQHAEDERHEMAALVADVHGVLVGAPDEVVGALDDAEAAGDVAGLTPLIDALYAWGLDNAPAVEALDRIRMVLRRDIDRRMEIAR